MAKLIRPTQTKIFGSAALAAELTEFGGSVPSTDINTILNNAASDRGWGTVGANGFPPMEWFNALGYGLSYYSAYLMQDGIPKWAALQNYYVNSYAVGSDGKIYRSKTGIDGTPNVGHDPVGDTVNWENSLDVAGTIHAATSKTTPVDADEIGIADSAASYVLKKLTFSNLFAWISSKISSVGLAGNLLFNTTAQRILGDFSNATIANRMMFQTSVTDGSTTIGILPNGTGTLAQHRLHSKSDVDNCGYMLMDIIDSSYARLVSNAIGTGATVPLEFWIGAGAKLRIDTSGNIINVGGGGLGYGTGSGGTVTQATSKSTTVTLNKPTGQITMNNAALAAGAYIQFAVNNTLVSASDTVIVNITGGSPNGQSYRIKAYPWNGIFYIGITNESAGSLSDACVINFAIIKGAIA